RGRRAEQPALSSTLSPDYDTVILILVRGGRRKFGSSHRSYVSRATVLGPTDSHLWAAGAAGSVWRGARSRPEAPGVMCPHRSCGGFARRECERVPEPQAAAVTQAGAQPTMASKPTTFELCRSRFARCRFGCSWSRAVQTATRGNEVNEGSGSSAQHPPA